MSQSVITYAFEDYLASSLQAEQPVVLDEIVLALIPGLDHTQPIDRGTVLPPAGQIVHRQPVDQRGRVNGNAVAYSIVMDTSVGDFEFNALFLVHAASETVAMVVHKETESKLATQPGVQTGNSLVKSMLMEYDGAAQATHTTVEAGTWQIDFSARLGGLDDDIRLQALETFGPAAFLGTGFRLVKLTGNDYQVTSGRAYIGGLRAELEQHQVLTIATLPVRVYADVHRTGSVLSRHINNVALRVSDTPLADYQDDDGYSHYVAELALVNADGAVTDQRTEGGWQQALREHLEAENPHDITPALIGAETPAGAAEKDTALMQQHVQAANPHTQYLMASRAQLSEGETSYRIIIINGSMALEEI
ncbi:hypothetical protein CGX12_16575 [Zobellella denitrificans]|uniref:phage tail-collar fiber domain-containing protein n=1 Tax=Zobellella denitrificans TaxID=347534 RepID=UPI000B8BE59F|nr:phage tail protein [Zobellella denitrificans]OXS13996.1 hypothetical protein CGX12_16575 [Zobellella denitrificans]